MDAVGKGNLLFLFLLLFADLAFISLHTIEFVSSSWNNPLFSLEKDQGFPEMFQYLKWFWIVLLAFFICITKKVLHFITWGIFFIYLLVDDAFGVHEKAGKLISEKFVIATPFGVRPQDLGELAISGIAGGILLFSIFWAYLRGPETFRKFTRDLLVLVVALAFFGIFMDLIHVFAFYSDSLHWKVSVVLAVIEDGGEMLVASLILWYVFRVSVTTHITPPYAYGKD